VVFSKTLNPRLQKVPFSKRERDLGLEKPIYFAYNPPHMRICQIETICKRPTYSELVAKAILKPTNHKK